jgi:hypothetical protein
MNVPTKIGGDSDPAAALARLYAVRFFRSRYPITPDLCELVSRAAQATPPELRALYIWGAHEKEVPDQADQDTLSHLRSLLLRMESVLGLTVSLQVVIADVHGTLNQVSPERSGRYAAAISNHMRERGWHVQWMSDLWRDAEITLERVEEVAVGLDVASDAPRLLRFSGRHFRGSSADEGARRYLAARLLERPVLSRHFRDHIYLTPVEPSLDFVQPELPIFHVWTRKKGCSAKPWFTTAEH